MKIRSLSLVVMLLIPATMRAEEVTATDVVKKAIEAHGGTDTLNKMKASYGKATGTIVLEGTEVPLTAELYSELPDKYKMKLVLEVGEQKIELENVVNGEKVKSTVNDKAQKLTDELKGEMRQALLLQEATGLTPLLDDKKFKIKKEDDEDVAGKPAFVLTVSSKELKEVRLSFDKKTGLLVKTSRKALAGGGAAAAKEVVEDTIVSDYKKIDGVMMPMKVVTNHDDKKYMTLKIDEAKAMEKSDDKTYDIDD